METFSFFLFLAAATSFSLIWFYLLARKLTGPKVWPIVGSLPAVFMNRRNFHDWIVERSASMVATSEPIHSTKEQHFKILHLVRHAQGIHNVAGQKDHSALSSFEYFDAQLSPHGLNEAKDLRERIHELGLLKRIELVVTSPLSRSVQTAVELFDHVSQSSEANEEGAVGCKCPPFVAVEHCRECVGIHPCDKRRSVTELRNLFPTVDFSLIETEDDVMWKADVRETKEEVAARGLKFMNWLWTQPEKEIAIITHNRFLEHTLNGLGHSIDPSIRTELCKAFKNCELRSVAMVGKRQEYPASDTTDELTDTAEKLSEYKLCGVPEMIAKNLSVSINEKELDVGTFERSLR